LIAVVVVLGILAALAVPTFNSVKDSSTKEVLTRSADAIYSDAKALAGFNADASQGVVTDANIETAVTEAGLNASYEWTASTNVLSFEKNGSDWFITIDATTGVSAVRDAA
jgi:type II secretory pathway pseudopilin PulG